MRKREIKLEFFNYPGCLIASNTAVYNNGYYEEVARISHAGNITWMIDKKRISDGDISRIEWFANNNKEKFTKQFEMETKDPYSPRTRRFYYDVMCECLTTDEWLKHTEECEKMTIGESIQALKSLYFQRN